MLCRTQAHTVDTQAHTQGIISSQSSIQCTPKAVMQLCKDIKSQLSCMKNVQSQLAKINSISGGL